MGVPVDESRQNQCASRIDRLRRLIFALELRPRAHLQNRVTFDDYRPIFNDRPQPVHRDHRPSAHDEIGFRLFGLCEQGSGQYCQRDQPTAH